MVAGMFYLPINYLTILAFHEQYIHAMGLFTKKPINKLIVDSSDGEKGLKRSLGPGNLIALGIGAIIGAGLFVRTAAAAANNAGPSVTIAFIVAGVGCAFAGLCYAEFASMIPVAGSAYTYSYATMGELVAWIIGWDLVLEYAVGAATVGIAWSEYLNKLLNIFNIHVPYQWCHSPFEVCNDKEGLFSGQVGVHGIMNLPALVIIFLLTMLLIRGMKQSAFVNGIIVISKVAIVIVFIVLGWGYMNPANHVPFVPPVSTYTDSQGIGHNYGGIWGILGAAGVVFFAFIGFDAVSTSAQEAKDPKKGMPIGIIGSLLVCTVLYVLFSHVMTGIANYKEFKDSAAPVAIAIAKTPYAWLQESIIVAILAGYTSVILVMLMGQSRIFFTMSKDGLLPKVFSKVHPKFQTPYKSNLFFAVFVSLFAAFVPVKVVGEMVSIGTLFAFVLVCIGVMVMRKSDPNTPRPFRAPWVPFVPVAGILICLSMMISLPGDTWIRLAVWMAIGLVIYFFYSKKHSLIRNGIVSVPKDPEPPIA